MWHDIEAVFAIFGGIVFAIYLVILIRPPRTADERNIDKLAAKKK